MRILVAPDSFKGSFTAREVTTLVASLLRALWPLAEVVECPLADGGEGTLDALASSLDLMPYVCRTRSPNGEVQDSRWALSHDGTLALAESAAAVGWAKVPEARRDPLHAWSDGVADLLDILHASTASTLVMGLGGTLVNDAGFGFAQSLGYRFFDRQGKVIQRNEATDVVTCLRTVFAYAPPAHDLPQDRTRLGLADVHAPLSGTRGATSTFGPQKGIPLSQLSALDDAISSFASVCDVSGRHATLDGAGAAGGLGWALSVFTGAQLVSGAEWVVERSGVQDLLDRVDLVITGEGRLDDQTRMGKVVGTLARHASQRAVPVVALCGRVDGDPESRARELGLHRVLAIRTDGGTDIGLHPREDLLSCLRAWCERQDAKSSPPRFLI